MLNVVVVLAAMLIVGAVAILGIQFIKKNINELTQKSTPYQLKALNQQRALQAHTANLLGASSSKTLEEFRKASENVSTSSDQVSQASEDMAKLKGDFFSSQDSRISEITKSILQITERKIKAHGEAVAAGQAIKARLSDASRKMKELDASIRRLQNSTSGSMLKSVDSFVSQSQHVNTLSAIRDGLKDLASYISKIPVTADKRSVAVLKDNADKTIAEVIEALKASKGIEKAAGEMIRTLNALDEKVTTARGLAFLQLQYISDEDDSIKDKVETMAKEAGYEIAYMMPTIEREIKSANASLKQNTGGMSKNISAFTDTDAILATASTLALLGAAVEVQMSNCIYAQQMADFNNDLSRINTTLAQIDGTARRLKDLLAKGNGSSELGILSACTGAFGAVRRDFLGGVSEKIRASILSTQELEQLNAKMKGIVSEQLAESNLEVASAGSNQEASVISVNKVANRTMIMVSVVGLLAIAVTLVLGILIGRAVANPLNSLVKSVQEVENKGKFAIDMGTNSNDEIGMTVKAFGSLISVLNETIGNINRTMAALAHNDLSSRVKIDAKGDLSTLKDNINSSIERLASTMSAIRENTGHVAAAAEQTRSAVNQVSEGSQHQLDSIRRLASAINESSASIAEVARNTETASVYSRETSEKVRDSQEKMKKMVQAVENIAKNSEKISTITDVIGQIADQTHLLSLNATIEAARAGQHGKGFAVVADEVRNLAENVARSVEEIAVLIEQAVGEAASGVEMAAGVNEVMETVSQAATQVDSMLFSIAQAMEEQNATIQEINENVSILNNTAEGNAAAAEEISVSVRELSGLAEETKNQVEQFKV